MPLNAATLSAKLQELDPVSEEPPVIEAWKTAVDFWFAESTVAGISPLVIPYDPGDPEAEPPVPPTPRSTPYDTMLAQFESAMAGISSGSTAVEGATIIVNAFVAFWGALAPIVATVWVTVPPLGTVGTIPPPLLATPALITSLATLFLANKDAALSKADSYDALAAALNTANVGALVINTAPTPVTLPVL